MLDFLITYLSKGKTFYGLEVYQINDTIYYRLLKVIKKKGELIIADSQNFTELQKNNKSDQILIPTCLVYNTSGVISKALMEKSNLKGRAAVEHKFPGLDFEKFYFQISTFNNQSLISVVRKKDIDEYLTNLKKLKLNIIGFSLGPGSITGILDYVNHDVILTNTEKFTLDNGSGAKFSISKIENSVPITYDVNGLSITNSELIAFSGILNFLSNTLGHNSNFDIVVQRLQNQFKNSRTSHIILRLALVVVLLLLLSNFFFFNFYHNNVQLSRESLVFENDNKKALTIMRGRVAEKEKKIDAALSISNSKTSYYLDKLGVTLPKSILLDQILYQPLKKPMQESKSIELHKHRILVMGTSANSEDFSIWIANLEALEWVKSVETMDYDYKDKDTSNFKIKVNVAVP